MIAGCPKVAEHLVDWANDMQLKSMHSDLITKLSLQILPFSASSKHARALQGVSKKFVRHLIEYVKITTA